MPETNPSILRDWAIWYLEKWLLVPYLWAGNDFSGMNCSGLVIEYLQSVGVLPHKYDGTADDLYNLFKNRIINNGLVYSGCLAFWFGFNDQGKRIAVHVGVVIHDGLVISSTGGGEETDSEEDAIRHNAFVKMRPLNYRGSDYKVVDPFKKSV